MVEQIEEKPSQNNGRNEVETAMSTENQTGVNLVRESTVKKQMKSNDQKQEAK